MPASAFWASASALLRAAVNTDLGVASPPDLAVASPEGAAKGVAWLSAIWAIPNMAEAIKHSSPDLAHEVATLTTTDLPPAAVAGAVMAVHRYVLRASGRATPFGLLAGVAAVASPATSRCGGAIATMYSPPRRPGGSIAHHAPA